MYTDLTAKDCEAVLAGNHYAHLGFHDGKDPYVLPITYLYHKGAVYSFTHEGMKIDAMRRNPHVCVQVEHVENGFTWRSVIAWGEFEQVTDEAMAKEMKVKLAHQYGTLTVKNREVPVSPMVAALHEDKAGVDRSVIYRVIPSRMTGKAASLR